MVQIGLLLSGDSSMHYNAFNYSKTNRNNLEIVAMNKLIPSLKDFFNILLTFVMTVFAWIFFRAENLHYAFNYISGIFNWSLFAVPKVKPTAYATLVLIGFL